MPRRKRPDPNDIIATWLNTQVDIKALGFDANRVHEGVRFATLYYDVSKQVRLEYGDPARALWGLGVRVAQSHWYIPTDRIPYALIRDLRERGQIADKADAAAHENARIIAAAREKLQEHLRHLASQLLQRVAAAQEAYEKALAEVPEDMLTEKVQDRLQGHRLSKIRRAIKLAGQDLDMAVQGMEQFDDGGGTTHDLIVALEDAIKAQQSALALLEEARVEARIRAQEAAQQEAVTPPVQRELAFTE